MSRFANISLVNFPTLPPDEPDRLQKTLDRMCGYVADAAQEQSDIVAFPEICNCLDTADPSDVAEPLDGPTVTALSQAARQHELYVVCPLIVSEDGRRYNCAVLIGRKGEIVGVYRKNFPTHPELEAGVTPGVETPVFETDFGRVGLCICFDLNYWEVGSGLCRNHAELVIWPSMWAGGRMLSKWAMEFGFNMAAVWKEQSTFVDVAGRELLAVKREARDRTGRSPVVTARIDLDRRLLHPDYNLENLKALFARYGPTAAFTQWLKQDCHLVFGSQVPGVSSDQLIEEFGLETMRDYLARVRRDRKAALAAVAEPVYANGQTLAQDGERI
ncbi:MAG: carbon-nitrogen hydrolase family protein [Caldilineaceae bacterium]|nr:carbon-nitrogen hydrolase family protein [Caldilineaceae bacterium]